jgi:hypothetical protein
MEFEGSPQPIQHEVSTKESLSNVLDDGQEPDVLLRIVTNHCHVASCLSHNSQIVYFRQKKRGVYPSFSVIRAVKPVDFSGHST